MAATAAAKRNVDVVRRFNEEVFNGRDYDLVSELQTEDYVQHGPMAGVEVHGTEEAVETMRLFHAAFSDLEATEAFSFGDGEYVCTHYIYRGTHDGDFMGIAPTDVEAEVHGTIVNRFEDGKVAEAWVTVDLLGLLQQVGAVPDLGEIAA